jgi:hypothetical protein
MSGLVSFEISSLTKRRSSPRKRESSPWTAHFRRLMEWIPAFAGMTAAYSARASPPGAAWPGQGPALHPILGHHRKLGWFAPPCRKYNDEALGKQPLGIDGWSRKEGARPSHRSRTVRLGGRHQNGILRVLRPFKASTQRPRRISVTSVLSFSWSQRTRRRYWFGKKSSRADKKFGNRSTARRGRN